MAQQGERGSMPVHEKLMSITAAEFAASLAAFVPGATLDDQGRVELTVAGVRGLITFETLPNRRLGGLVSMPQARVTLSFPGPGTTPAEARTFIRRFDIAFQRGGG